MSTSVKCIILEDNEADMDLLTHFVKSEPRLLLQQTFKNPLEAIAYIQQQQPPLIFMDIDMPVMSGMELFKSLDYNPLCIFVTAYSNFALESYDARAFDFILKPVTAKRFNETLARVDEYVEIKSKAELYDASFEGKRILLKEGTVTHQIELHDILYLEALKDYTKVVTTKRKFITLSKLKHFMEKLPPIDFIRIHRSYAVAKSKIEKIGKDEVTVLQIVLPVGKTYKQELRQMIN